MNQSTNKACDQTSSPLILSIKDLCVSYGGVEALKGIDIEVPEGSIVALLGANGAGKTTTLKTLSGLVKPTQGEVTFLNQNIQNSSPEKIAKMGLAQSPEGRQVFKGFTVQENLEIGAFTLSDRRKVKESMEWVFGYFPVLKERKNQMASTLSGGEQQMLAIGRALMSRPKVLLLDEPSLGLAPLIVKDILNIVQEIKKSGTTVVIVEQNAAQTLKIADYAYVLEVGKIKMHGESSALLKDPALLEAYLGKENG